MTRKTFLAISSCLPMLVGLFALAAPQVLIESVKMAAPSEAANVMARTAGILLFTFGVLNFLIRNEGDTKAMEAILVSNPVLQLGIMPIDPLAYVNGVFHTLRSARSCPTPSFTCCSRRASHTTCCSCARRARTRCKRRQAVDRPFFVTR